MCFQEDKKVTDKSLERRRFIRIPFSSTAHIKSKAGDMYLNCHVHDVSLKGLLITRPRDWQGQLNDAYQIDLLLEDGSIVIKMDAVIAHIAEDAIGFVCEQIDLDSISHLKRLVELNLGDEDLLHRELHMLIKTN
jgi:hypothetical protein